MQDDEVAHFLVNLRHAPVVVPDQHLVEIGVREQFEQHFRAFLDQIDAGRLDRLQKAGCEADRNAVLDPEISPPADAHAQQPRLRLVRVLLRVQREFARGGVIGNEAAGINVARTHAMAQRNAPDPAGAERGGPRVRLSLIHI